jgi:hypothetical protein
LRAAKKLLPHLRFTEEVYLETPFPTTCSRDHESSTRRTLRSFLPKEVGEYSTRTGISANISRLISLSLSNSRSCWVRTFCEIRGIFFRRTLKRSGFRDPISHQRITGFHRPPISISSSSIGHMLAMRLALIAFGNQVSVWFLVSDREYNRRRFYSREFAAAGKKRAAGEIATTGLSKFLGASQGGFGSSSVSPISLMEE